MFISKFYPPLPPPQKKGKIKKSCKHSKNKHCNFDHLEMEAAEVKEPFEVILPNYNTIYELQFNVIFFFKFKSFVLFCNVWKKNQLNILKLHFSLEDPIALAI